MKIALAVLAVIAGEMAVQQINGPRLPEPDACHRSVGSALGQNVDGARYNVDELCKIARQVAGRTP